MSIHSVSGPFPTRLEFLPNLVALPTNVRWIPYIIGIIMVHISPVVFIQGLRDSHPQHLNRRAYRRFS